jgi:hypothetical protein
MRLEYVVRELKKQRVWFAEPLISSSYAEISYSDSTFLIHYVTLSTESNIKCKKYITCKKF